MNSMKVQMELQNITNQVNQLTEHLAYLSNEYNRNMDMFGEGYGNTRDLQKCQARIQKAMNADQKKIQSLKIKYNKLQNKYGVAY